MENIRKIVFNIVFVPPCSQFRAGRNARNNTTVQEGSVSNSPTCNRLLLLLQNCWCYVAQDRGTILSAVSPTRIQLLASCVRSSESYRGRESSLTSPGATSFLHDLNLHTYTRARAQLAISKRKLPRLSALLSNKAINGGRRIDKMINSCLFIIRRKCVSDGRKLLLLLLL